MRERLKYDDIVALDAVLVPKGVVLPSEIGKVDTAATIIEIVHLIDAGKAQDELSVIHIEDKLVLDALNKHAHLFPLAVAVLEGVPGGEYDVVFNNYTHLLPAIEMGELIDATSKDDADINKVAQAKVAGKIGHSGSDRLDRKSDRIVGRVRDRNVSNAPVPESIFARAASAGVVPNPDVMNDDLELGDSGIEE